MESPTFDPGLTQKYTGSLQQTINDKGEFNVRRAGSTLRDFHPYLFLISTSWTVFVFVVLGAFVAANLLFATMYEAIGLEHLKGAEAQTAWSSFVNAFFFSTHTLTTVGYGNIYPVGPIANATSALEALVGLLGFAVITGLMFGRFSRPNARVAFSRKLLVTPYEDGLSLQLRVVNRRTNNLLELNAQVLLMTVERVSGTLRRNFSQLKLERSSILFFPLTWTIVHPLTPESPLYEKTPAELAELQAEIMVLLKGFDETFGQTVNTRHSYRYDEIVWGGRFTPAFDIDETGELVLQVNRVSSFEPVRLSAQE